MFRTLMEVLYCGGCIGLAVILLTFVTLFCVQAAVADIKKIHVSHWEPGLFGGVFFNAHTDLTNQSQQPMTVTIHGITYWMRPGDTVRLRTPLKPGEETPIYDTVLGVQVLAGTVCINP